MAVTLEQVLTHPKAFGLTSASPVQRAICRVADGLPLGELASDANVQRALGGAVDRLPRTMPRELYLIAAIRTGKSLFAGALAVRATQACDLSKLSRHEIARVSVVSLDLDKARIVLEHLFGALTRPAFRPRLVDKPKADSVRLRRDDGRIVEIKVVAGKRAGGSLVSRWSAGAIFDEAPRMQGAADGVVNFEQSRQAVLARLLPGAQLAAVGSPWAPRGPIYEVVQSSWGKPSARCVVIRATGPEMNPVVWTPEAVEALRQHDMDAYRTDVLGEFADPETAFFGEVELRAATREVPLVRTYDRSLEYFAAMDPATRGNAWTLVIVGKEENERIFVAFCRQWQGTRSAPLRAKAVFAEMAEDLKRYHLNEVHTDQWAGDLVTETGGNAGITVHVHASTQLENAKRAIDFRDRVLAGGVELAPEPTLRADLLSMRKRLTPNGMTFDFPTTADGRHADYAPAVILATDQAARGPTWVSAMQRWRARGG